MKPPTKKLRRGPNAPKKREGVIMFRVSASEKKTIETAAREAGYETAQWVRLRALRAAESERS
jgi:uncharacterized protein (DUF1778 family)